MKNNDKKTNDNKSSESLTPFVMNNKTQEFSSPKKNESTSKKYQNIKNKKYSKTLKKTKNNIISINEIEKTTNRSQKKKQKKVLFIQQKDNNNKKEKPNIISTNHNFTPNKRQNIQFRASETQSKKKGKFRVVEKNLNETENYKDNCYTKRNRLVYKSNNKSNKTSNINSLILNFNKDIPNYQNRIKSITCKKSSNNIENNSYILTQKKNTLKDNDIDIDIDNGINVNQKRNVMYKKHKEFNSDNYTIKIAKNKNFSVKKKKDNIIYDKEINKQYFKSYIINKYSISFVKNHLKIIDEFKKSNRKLSHERKFRKNNNKSQSQYKTSFNFSKNNQTVPKSLINSKNKSSKNIKDNNKSNLLKKKYHSSLTTNKKTKKSIYFLDKNNLHQMTDFSKSFNNNSIPITINKIKFNLNKKFKNSTDRPLNRDLFSKEKETENEDEESQILKKIKKNINMRKFKDKNNKTIRNKEKKHKMQYPRINSHKILITNININLYKEKENNENNYVDNYYINSEEGRNSILNMNIDESKIDLEKIYLLEEKIKKIIIKINEYKTCEEECQNFITYYFSVNFYKKIIGIFEINKNEKKMANYIKLEILCYLLCYNISFNENFNQASILLKSIINILHDNYMILMVYILHLNKNRKPICENKIVDNLWLDKIEKIIDNEMKINLTVQDMNENTILALIVNSNKTIINYYKMIIENLYFLNNAEINDINTTKSKSNMDNINSRDSEEKYIFPNCLLLDVNKVNKNEKIKIINIFFSKAYKYLNNFTFDNMKLFFYLFLNNPKYTPLQKNRNNNIINLSQYYLPPIKPNFKYSLLINLDETLIYNNKGKIILRPNLEYFLNMIKTFYELIVFSFESNTLVDNIVELIEQKNKFFDYILYANQFTLSNKGKLVKDLENLGRNLKNVIVIDTKIHLEKKYKNNLILIKPFYGNNLVDINMLKILGYILLNIKKENYEDDIRTSIYRYRNLIKTYLMNHS